ncbi:hypothetical protein SAMN05444365_101465 [Micromonospora pattaloongensis]|uniref:Uncharacterized protein n=1 Tax=Micromonospora pattaloongensis TaxID=405436 RepID=A0A1H3GL83_9ACTN|nr:hypothetical protein [Micromonospora pattaloongensis]SDY04083.1 hypothetical protein SAMN05444365_101465 [Micromonospora pattaloongensis]
MVEPQVGVVRPIPQQVTGNQVEGGLAVAGRDNNITTYLTGLRRLRPRPVDPEAVMPENQFVEPGFFASPLREIRSPIAPNPPVRIVVLRAPEGYGRRSAGLRLLASTTTPRERLFELLPDWDIPDAESLPQESNSGYLLNLRGVSQPLPNQFYEDLIGYARKLQARGSYLVVTATSSVWTRAWVDGVRHGILVQDIGCPNSVDVVKKYLRARPAVAERASWVDDPSSVFYGVLPENSSPSESVRLAHIIAVADNSKDEEKLDEYRGWRDKLSQWFSGGTEEVEVRAIRITGSLLNGAPAAVLLDCADQLLLAPEINLPPREGGLLARPDARSRLKPAGISFDAKTGAASLIHDSQGPAILEYVWKEHTQLSQVLTRWLQEISRGSAQGHLEVLASSLSKLAEAVGLTPLLTLAEGWLVEGEEKSIDLVGDLLSDLAVHPIFGSQVRAELTKWASGKREPSRQRAVARAISGEFGRTYPSQALTRAKYLLVSAGTPQVSADAVKAVRGLVGAPDIAVLAVDTIVKWITPTDGKPAAVETGVFLDVFAPPAENQSDFSPLQVALTRSGQAEQAVRARLVDGWLQVIRQGPQRDSAVPGLLSWRRAAEDDQLPQEAVVDVLIQLGRVVGHIDPPVRDVIAPEGKLRGVLISRLFAQINSAYGLAGGEIDVVPPRSEDRLSPSTSTEIGIRT